MIDEVERQLKARHPVLLKPLHDRRFRRPIGHDGIECGEGWFALIDDLCTAIETVMEGEHLTYVQVQQIKEKLGYLEFYIGVEPDSPAIERLVQASRERSATTCEKCGAVGKRRADGWLIVLCDAHHEDRSWAGQTWARPVTCTRTFTFTMTS